MKKLLILLVLAGAAGVGWYGWHTYGQARREAAPVFHGNIDIREVRLGFRVAGRVTEVLKEEGDPVAPGEILARLDAGPYRTAVEQAAAQAGQTAARLEEMRNGSRPEELEQARRKLAAAEAEVENARLVFERQKQLVAGGAVARQDYDTARLTYRNARAQRDALEASLALLEAGTRAEQISQAEAALQAARAGLAQARIQLADATLTAPEAGVVLTRVVEPGSMVQTGSTALTVSLITPVRVRAYVSEPQLGLVQPGRDVLVFTDSRSEPYHGQVGDVSPRAEFTPKSVETEELRTALVYRFRVTLSDADDGLRQGMPVTVRLKD
jgi:HlyD family secretion protein